MQKAERKREKETLEQYPTGRYYLDKKPEQNRDTI